MRKAVILAAGRGARMKHLTLEVPKPLLPLHGKPMLVHVLDRLRQCGTTDVLIVIGHLGEQIRAALANYPAALQFQLQQSVNGTARAALLARDFVGADAFLLTFADILTHPEDYSAMWRSLESDSACEGVVGVKWVADPYQGAAVYEQSGVITRILEKPPEGTSSTHWNSSGQYVFRPNFFNELEHVPLSPRGEYELTSAIEATVAAGRRMRMYALTGGWRDVGRPEDLAEAERIISENA